MCLAFTGVIAAQEPQDTQMQGVTARVAYARQAGGVLRVGIVLKNTGTAEFRGTVPITYANAALLDAKSKKKQFVAERREGALPGWPGVRLGFWRAMGAPSGT